MFLERCVRDSVRMSMEAGRKSVRGRAGDAAEGSNAERRKIGVEPG